MLSRVLGRRTARAATALVVSLATCVVAWSDSTDAQLQRLQQQLDELRAQVASLHGQGSDSARLAEIERQIAILATEVERLKAGEAAPAANEAAPGLGPAASKVYRLNQGVSIGGYGELVYENFDGDRDDGAPSDAQDQADFLRAVLYFGYKFDDRFVFNSEIEFEHGSTGDDGEVSVEFGYLDYLASPKLAVRAGLVLVPVGLINELHEPTTFLGAKRPDVERTIIPTTWREIGAGIWGDLGPLTYRTYILTGLDASGFTAGGIRDGRQNGSKAAASDFAWVGRLDYTGSPGLLVGASAYTGESGQGLRTAAGEEIGARTNLFEGHLEWKWRGLQLRALAATTQLDDVAELNAALDLEGGDTVGQRTDGVYVELGYDILSAWGAAKGALVPFARWEMYDTQAEVPPGFTRDPARDVEVLTLGVAWSPIDQLAIKADYQNYRNEAGTGVDQFNVALGWIF